MSWVCKVANTPHTIPAQQVVQFMRRRVGGNAVVKLVASVSIAHKQVGTLHQRRPVVHPHRVTCELLLLGGGRTRYDTLRTGASSPW